MRQLDADPTSIDSSDIFSTWHGSRRKFNNNTFKTAVGIALSGAGASTISTPEGRHLLQEAALSAERIFISEAINEEEFDPIPTEQVDHWREEYDAKEDKIKFIDRKTQHERGFRRIALVVPETIDRASLTDIDLTIVASGSRKSYLRPYSGFINDEVISQYYPVCFDPESERREIYRLGSFPPGDSLEVELFTSHHEEELEHDGEVELELTYPTEDSQANVIFKNSFTLDARGDRVTNLRDDSPLHSWTRVYSGKDGTQYEGQLLSIGSVRFSSENGGTPLPKLFTDTGLEILLWNGVDVNPDEQLYSGRTYDDEDITRSLIESDEAILRVVQHPGHRWVNTRGIIDSTGRVLISTASDNNNFLPIRNASRRIGNVYQPRPQLVSDEEFSHIRYGYVDQFDQHISALESLRKGDDPYDEKLPENYRNNLQVTLLRQMSEQSY